MRTHTLALCALARNWREAADGRGAARVFASGVWCRNAVHVMRLLSLGRAPSPAVSSWRAVAAGNEVTNPCVVTKVYMREGDIWTLGSRVAAGTGSIGKQLQ